MNALVIGAGVSGLTSALALQEAGWAVTLWAREEAPNIVSNVAAAIWLPYQVAHPAAERWALRTAERLGAIMHDSQSGIRLVQGCEFHRAPTPPPSWAGQLADFRQLLPDELPPGYVTGYSYELPVIETPLYLAWLRAQVRQRGSTIERREVARVEEVLGDDWPLVVNCMGLGAREAVGDTTMYPIRGQIVRLAPGLTDQFLFDDSEASSPIYLIPRADGTVVGGTAQHGDWDCTLRPTERATILARATQLLPAVASAPVLAELVGLRPGRPTVRLEAEQHGPTRLIHNYGHGGAGFTLSWGCAEEVVALSR